MRRKIFNGKKERIDKNGKITQKGFKKSTTFEMFEEWFHNSNFEKGCYYCGITNSESNILFELQQSGKRNNATRGGKRGRRLELERKNPSKPYDELENLVWCCYWCNNAKSNFFTEEEFIPIAEKIGKALKKIIEDNG